MGLLLDEIHLFLFISMNVNSPTELLKFYELLGSQYIIEQGYFLSGNIWLTSYTYSYPHTWLQIEKNPIWLQVIEQSKIDLIQLFIFVPPNFMQLRLAYGLEIATCSSPIYREDLSMRSITIFYFFFKGVSH